MLKVPQSMPGSKKSDTGSPLLAALKCAYHLMQQRIISTPKDLMGILLYGTETSKFYEEDEDQQQMAQADIPQTLLTPGLGFAADPDDDTNESAIPSEDEVESEAESSALLSLQSGPPKARADVAGDVSGAPTSARSLWNAIIFMDPPSHLPDTTPPTTPRQTL